MYVHFLFITVLFNDAIIIIIIIIIKITAVLKQL